MSPAGCLSFIVRFQTRTRSVVVPRHPRQVKATLAQRDLATRAAFHPGKVYDVPREKVIVESEESV